MAIITDIIQRGTRAAQPAATAVSAGTLYYVTDEGKTERSTGAAWQDCSDSGSAAHDILSATHSDSLTASVVRGDLLIGNSTPKWARLAKGTSGHVLTMGANDPAWTASTTGASAQDFIDAIWLKKFFSDASLLPTTERIVASLVTCPSETAVVLGTFTKYSGGALISGAPALAYWDLGALRSDVLVVWSGLHPGAAANLAILLSPGVPTDANPASGYSIWTDTTNGYRIQRTDGAGAYTALTTHPTAVPLPTATSGIVGMALYYKDSTNVLKHFIRTGGGGWWLASETTDSTHTTMRYVSVRLNNASTGRLVLPFTAWSD